MALNDAVWTYDQRLFADGFVEGFYRYDRREHVGMPVRVWFGPPLGPDGREEDRSPRWQLMLAGVRIDDERTDRLAIIAKIDDVWPRALRSPIPEREYRFLLARIRHARAHRPYDSFADVRGKINPLNFELPWE